MSKKDETGDHGGKQDLDKSRTQLVTELQVLREQASLFMDADEESGKKRMLFTLLDGVPDSIFFKDLEGRYSLINRTLALQLGLEHPREAIGKMTSDFLPAEDAEVFWETEKKVIKTGLPVVDKEEQVLWPNGSVSWLSITLMPLHNDDGEVVGLYGLSRDISRRRKTEQELRDTNVKLSDALVRLKRTQQQIIQHERLSALGQMASGIAHNFNNALMPILGYSDLIIENPVILDEDREESLRMIKDIREAAQKAAESVRRLRDFYHPREHDDAAVIDISYLLRETIALTEPRWKEEMEAKGVIIKVQEALEDIPAIMGDEGRLQEAFTNLIMNSVDAMPGGGVIDVVARIDDRGILIQIKDTGTGMPEDVLRMCFEPFFTTKGVYGTGMGLSVAYGIVQQHDGTLAITSQPGKGSSVEIRLPMPALIVPKEPRAPEAVAMGSIRILVIDDDRHSRTVVKACLERFGHTVATADTAKGGLDRCKADDFDLVITDRAMPDMSGDDVALAVKKMKPNLTVVMLTGFGDLMRSAEERPRGVDLVVPKPVTEWGLAKAIEQVVGTKEI